jgi:hypothetical protein
MNDEPLKASGKHTKNQKTIEHGPVEIGDLHIKNSGSFHSYVTVYQRVNHQ